MVEANQTSRRRYFLQDIPLEEATARWFGALNDAGALVQMPGEDAPLTAPDIVGRVTARPVWAVASSPHYDAAAMDGIAVRAADTVGATETRPVALDVGSQAVWVDTGDPMPAGMDAVVMIEHVQRDPADPSAVRVYDPVAPWQHVRPLGEDIVATELVLPENHRITPADLGACAAAGLTTVPVRRRPRVAIIPTGDELAPIAAPRKPGDIPEFNSLILAALIRQWGGEPVVREPAPDDFDAIREAVASGLASSDVVAINAGSSAGDADYTAAVIESLGTLQVHGIAVRPGHPVALGVASGKAVMGLPGYPVSAALTAELLLLPLLELLLGTSMPSRPRISANMTRKVASPTGEDEFLRVAVGQVGDRMIATPVQRGAGVVMSLVRADGIVRIPRHTEGVDAGAEVEVELLRPLEEVRSAIVAIGSHDLALDLMRSFLRRGNSAGEPGVGPRGQPRRAAGLATGRSPFLRLPPAGHRNRRVQYVLRPPLPAGHARRHRPPGGSHPGPDDLAREPVEHRQPRRPAATRGQVRQPPAGFGHPGAAGLPAPADGRSARCNRRLPARGIQPPGGGGGGVRRVGRHRLGRPVGGPGPGAGIRAPAQRGV